jgi:HD-GYP domain-containing protein (c-di-GMP phosphodiesterase class II)
MRIRIEKPLLKSLTLMASVIEARDVYTGGHLWRVSQYSQRLALAVGMTPEMIFLAGLGGFLHDIGKISIPDQILGKQGHLTDSEYEVVKTHPGIGAVLIQEHPLGNLALAAVHQHHEWVDGSGYPQRLEREQISIYARIVSIADAFDALTSTRPYRREVEAEPAVEALRVEHGTQFDTLLLDAFVRTVQIETLKEVVGHSQPGVSMVRCKNCGPVISVAENTQDGDTGICRVCGTRHRLHRDGDTFMVEPMGVKGTAEELQPLPERAVIEAFIDQAPEWVEVHPQVYNVGV